VNWTNITSQLVDAVAEIAKGKKVLEVFAGSGELAKQLCAKGVTIHPTTVTMDTYDGYNPTLWQQVEIIDAVSACRKYKDDFDYLLAAWPIADDTLLHCALIFDKPIIYIGQLWHNHPQNTYRSYSGTASDAYFENVEEVRPTIFDASPNSVLSLHKIKDKLLPQFSPSLLMYEWADRNDLVRLYNEKPKLIT
tara:strand:- start:14934 stop:15512 length:579 start_codon:yes stop_codon:yes gene_type:complete